MTDSEKLKHLEETVYRLWEDAVIQERRFFNEIPFNLDPGDPQAHMLTGSKARHGILREILSLIQATIHREDAPNPTGG